MGALESFGIAPRVASLGVCVLCLGEMVSGFLSYFCGIFFTELDTTSALINSPPFQVILGVNQCCVRSCLIWKHNNMLFRNMFICVGVSGQITGVS